MAKHKKRLAQPAQVAVNSDSEYEQPSVNRNPRNANEADETLENLHQDSSPIATYNIQQCCDTLKCFNKMHDKRSVTKYLDLLDTISNTLLTIAHNYEQNDSKIHNILEELKQDIKNKPASPTYSQVLQRNPQTTQISIPKYDEKTIIVKPNDSTPPQIIENKIKEIIKKSNTKTKINSIYSKQTCVIIKTPNNDKDCDQLLNQINSDAETKNTCKAYEPKKRDPTILIKNVASDTDLLKLAEQIAECNPELEGLEDDMEYLFKLKYSDTAKHMNVVLKTSPKVYHIITTQMNNRIYLDFQCCNIQTKIFIRQCQKCFSFNHKKGDCKNRPICKTCGEHKEDNHSCSGNTCCINCKNSTKYKNDTSHSPNTEHCPIYKTQVERSKEQTQYRP